MLTAFMWLVIGLVAAYRGDYTNMYAAIAFNQAWLIAVYIRKG